MRLQRLTEWRKANETKNSGALLFFNRHYWSLRRNFIRLLRAHDGIAPCATILFISGLVKMLQWKNTNEANAFNKVRETLSENSLRRRMHFIFSTFLCSNDRNLFEIYFHSEAKKWFLLSQKWKSCEIIEFEQFNRET